MSAWQQLLDTSRGAPQVEDLPPAVVAQGLSFAAQAAAPGAGYQLIDFTVAFLRSPAVDGRTVQVHTRPVKVGRRLGVFAADLYDGDVLLASGTADARFD